MTTDASWEMRKRREELRAKTKGDAEAIFRLGGFTVSKVWELANGYWPDNTEYDDVRAPWWLFMTEIGPVLFGRRKRVFVIEWDACAYRGVITEDDTTKGNYYVHAWTTEKAVEYLKALHKAATTPAAETGSTDKP